MIVLFAGGGTGGHLYPALAIARAMVHADARVEPFFLGARRGIEREILPASEFEHDLLELHPLYRQRVWNNWRTVAGGAGAWARIARLVRDRRPRALVATGGYAAGVALGVARSRRLPIVLQEQNSFPGLTVRAFARAAAQIHLGFPEAAARLTVAPATRVFVSGNPIEPPAQVARSSAMAAWGFLDESRPVVLVFGGSQGAAPVNEAVAGWIAAAPHPAPYILWSTGRASYERYAPLESEAVRVRPFIAPMRDAYAAASIAVARAGAMTTAELAAWGLPAILVPLPTAAADHQTANARALAEAGAAVMIHQRELSPESLRSSVSALLGDATRLDQMRGAALDRARPNAAQAIARHILGMPCFN